MIETFEYPPEILPWVTLFFPNSRLKILSNTAYLAVISRNIHAFVAYN